MSAVASRPEPTVRWVNAQVGSDILGTYPKRLKELAAAGHIRVLKLPNCRPRYAWEDIVRLLPAPNETTTAGSPEG
jgi:hypothetical protein